MKKTTYSLFIALSILASNGQTKASPSLKKLALCAGTAATTGFGYLYCSTPQGYTPTIETLQTLSAVPLENTDLTQKTLFESQTPVSFTSSIIMGISKTLFPTIAHQEKPLLITASNKTYTLQPGTVSCALNTDEPIWIASCGWTPGFDPDEIRGINPNIRLAKRYLGRNIIHGPALFIAHNDSRRIFNFGQDADQKNIDFIYHQVTGKKVIFHGLCRGVTAILGWMQHYENDNNICAFIFESPAVSLKMACIDKSLSVSHSNLAGTFTHSLFSFYYPNYNPLKAEKQKEIESLHIAKDVPIFIGTLKQDAYTSFGTVTNLVRALRKKSSNPLYYFVCDDSMLVHAQLSKSKTYQQAVNAFLKKYNLPHDEKLAEQGQELLEKARIQANALVAGSH